jgi:UTP--glucose-1-phosphate uridylyltransferase
MLPDEIHGGGKTMSRLAAAADRLGGSTIAAVAVASHEVSRYGMLECEHDLDGSNHWESRVLDLIEKPALGDEPSLYASVGRYLLDSAVLDALDEIEPGAGGELQLADAIALSALRGALITALRVDAQRLDRHARLTPSSTLIAVAVGARLSSMRRERYPQCSALAGRIDGASPTSNERPPLERVG